MTSLAVPPRHGSRRPGVARRFTLGVSSQHPGLTMLAATMLVVVGLLTTLVGIEALVQNSLLQDRLVYTNLDVRGWAMACAGIAQALAGSCWLVLYGLSLDPA